MALCVPISDTKEQEGWLEKSPQTSLMTVERNSTMTFRNLMFTQGLVFVFSSIRKQLITAQDDEAQDEISNSGSAA